MGYFVISEKADRGRQLLLYFREKLQKSRNIEVIDRGESRKNDVNGPTFLRFFFPVETQWRLHSAMEQNSPIYKKFLSYNTVQIKCLLPTDHLDWRPNIGEQAQRSRFVVKKKPTRDTGVVFIFS